MSQGLLPVNRGAHYSCPYCHTVFRKRGDEYEKPKTGLKYEGPKRRAEKCRDLGEPPYKYQEDSIAGERQTNEIVTVLGRWYTRRVARREGKVTSAQHVKMYRVLVHSTGKTKVLAEKGLVPIRSASA